MSDKNLVVCKANSIIEAGYRLSLNEQRTILACIGKVNSVGELLKTDVFHLTAKEFATEFNISEDRAYSELKEIAKNLYQRSLTFYNPDPNNPKLEKIETRWISAIGYTPTEGKISLYFSPQVIPYLSNLKGSFTKYKLRHVAGMSSTYGIRLYELLMQWKNIGKREIEIAWLKKQFQLDDSYSRMDNFKKRVIEPAIKDINEYSNFTVTWEQRKTGRAVTHLIFTFAEKQPEAPEEKPQEIKPKPKAAITLTEEQQACFDWAKNQPHWQKFTKNKKSFLTCFNNTVEGGLKDQWLETLPKSAQPKQEKAEPTAAQLKNQRKVEISNLRNAIKQMEGLNKLSPNPAITAQIEQLKQQLEEKMKS